MKLPAALTLAGIAFVIVLSADDAQAVTTCTYKKPCPVATQYCWNGYWCWHNGYRLGSCATSAACTETWSDWGACTKTCGGGTRTRSAVCKSTKCSKSYTRTEKCNTHMCPRNGGWTAYGPFRCSGCSATCGVRIINTCTRTRKCENPTAAYGGTDCKGSKTFIKTYPCSVPRCPVDGKWTDWSNWNCAACAKKSCLKSRSCTDPAPRYGGRDCVGLPTEKQYQTCKTKVCHPKGGWTDYTSDWICSDCSKTCGGGTQTCSVTRTCEEQPCVGSNTISKSRTCNTHQCPVNGQWSKWLDGQCGDCNKKCGSGEKDCNQFRLCNNPAPAHGGRQCVGPTAKTTKVPCSGPPCPVNGIWSAVGEDKVYGSCSNTCGPGTRSVLQFRKCDNPPPQNGGSYCTGSNIVTSTEACNVRSCIPVGTWSSYTPVWKCSPCIGRTCGVGEETCSINRTCVQPPCQGSKLLSISSECYTTRCSVDGRWSVYKLENICGECSTTCGPGTKTCFKSRKCNDPRPDFGGENCEGRERLEYSEPCNIGNCSVEAPTCEVTCDEVASGYVAFYPHESKCNKFYRCEIGHAYEYDCPDNVFWNDAERKCDWIHNVNCYQCNASYQSCVKDDGGILCALKENGCPSGTRDTTIIVPPADEDPMSCSQTQPMIADNTPGCRGYYQCVNSSLVHKLCANGTQFSASIQACVTEECEDDNQGPVVVCTEGTKWDVESKSCDGYTECSHQHLVYMTCPNDTRFHTNNQTCVEPEHVECPEVDGVLEEW